MLGWSLPRTGNPMCTAPVAVRTQHIQTTGKGQYGWRTISNWKSGAETLEMGSGLYPKSKGYIITGFQVE